MTGSESAGGGTLCFLKLQGEKVFKYFTEYFTLGSYVWHLQMQHPCLLNERENWTTGNGKGKMLNIYFISYIKMISVLFPSQPWWGTVKCRGDMYNMFIVIPAAIKAIAFGTAEGNSFCLLWEQK